MKIYVKKNGKLNILGEGKIYSKSQLRLNEGGIDANIPVSDNLKQAQIKAQQMINRDPSVTSASADAGKLDGQKDTQSGEGLQVKLPINANAQQLNQAQQMTKGQNADDVQITFDKSKPTSDNLGESRIIEMRKNAIPFSKKELSSFLKEI